MGTDSLTVERQSIGTLSHTVIPIACPFPSSQSAAVVNVELTIGIDHRITVVDATGAHACARSAGGVHAHAGAAGHYHDE